MTTTTTIHQRGLTRMLAPFPTNLRSFLLVLTSVLVSANCFAVSTKVNRGPIHARSFNFVSRTGKPDANISDNRETVHKLIQSAITRNLQARGVKRVNGGGDLAVRYLL